MKKISTLAFLLFFPLMLFSQGLEDVIIEPYYVSDANDATAEGGTLPAGSVTYRIYVDMAPGWVLRSVYCSKDYAHDLKIATTTLFFNNTDAGEIIANYIQDPDLTENTVMLDSWISLGGAAAGKLAVFKSEDSDGSLQNGGEFLQNTSPKAGIPVKEKDGLKPGTPTPVTLSPGMAVALSVFDDANAGPEFYTDNESWFNNSTGAEGPTADNRVLVAQVTTNGTLSYYLNFMLARKSDGKVEKYVHSFADPDNNEIDCPKCRNEGIVLGNEEIKYNPEADLYDVQLRPFPNPAEASLNIDLNYIDASGNAIIYIMNIIGKPVLCIEKSVTGNVIRDIDISSIPDGFYLVRIKTDDGKNVTGRFIKK